MATWVGKRIDYHCTSLGKALIAWLPDDEIRSLVREHHMLRHNENTISTLSKLKENLMSTRSAGYAVDDEEEEIGIRCVGAPVLGVSGKVEAAISVSGHGRTDSLGRPSAVRRHVAGIGLRDVTPPRLDARTGRCRGLRRSAAGPVIRASSICVLRTKWPL